MHGFRNGSEERVTYGQREETCGARSICSAPGTLLKMGLECFMVWKQMRAGRCVGQPAFGIASAIVGAGWLASSGERSHGGVEGPGARTGLVEPVGGFWTTRASGSETRHFTPRVYPRLRDDRRMRRSILTE